MYEEFTENTRSKFFQFRYWQFDVTQNFLAEKCSQITKKQAKIRNVAGNK